jgi:hypothetical protein
VFWGHRANHRLKGRYIRDQILLRQGVRPPRSVL